jgi:hypothetical protein
MQDIVYSSTIQSVIDDKVVISLVSYTSLGHLTRDVEGTSKFEYREQYLHTRGLMMRQGRFFHTQMNQHE